MQKLKEKPIRKVAFLTAGGLAPCLSSSIGYLIEEYTKVNPKIQMIGYINGYMGLLQGKYIKVTPSVRRGAKILIQHGGSPIGNSRVKLTNVDDCVSRGLIKKGQDPLHVAAEQLVKDKIDVLHTIGGDDTSTTAADLAAYLSENNYKLTVVGLPKTIDNDIFPIKQSLGAYTAAEQGALYFSNIVKENSANPNMFIIHEVMGRNCGYLTAQTAIEYRKMIKNNIDFLPSFNLTMQRQDINAVYIPEMSVSISKEAKRLKKIMQENDCVNIFVSEGACVNEIVSQLKKDGVEIPRDAFGHVKLDKVNPGAWFGDQFSKKIGAEKTLVQKSGYFARSAKPGLRDRQLIRRCCKVAVKNAINHTGGLIGMDEDAKDRIRACEFDRVRGGKPYNYKNNEFMTLLREIGQV